MTTLLSAHESSSDESDVVSASPGRTRRRPLEDRRAGWTARARGPRERRCIAFLATRRALGRVEERNGRHRPDAIARACVAGAEQPARFRPRGFRACRSTAGPRSSAASASLSRRRRRPRPRRTARSRGAGFETRSAECPRAPPIWTKIEAAPTRPGASTIGTGERSRRGAPTRKRKPWASTVDSYKTANECSRRLGLARGPRGGKRKPRRPRRGAREAAKGRRARLWFGAEKPHRPMANEP